MFTFTERVKEIRILFGGELISKGAITFDSSMCIDKPKLPAGLRIGKCKEGIEIYYRLQRFFYQWKDILEINIKY